MAAAAESSAERVLAVSNHPVLLHKLSLMRSKEQPPREFRRLLREITFYVGYEATNNLLVQDSPVETPVATCSGFKIAETMAIVPILRAGLGMVEPMLELIPNAAVHHIGMYRQKESRRPVQYYNRLPNQDTPDVTFVLDPMIATGCTVIATVGILKNWGTKKIIVVAALASRAGIDAFHAAHPDVPVHVAAVDDVLTDGGLISPGLGDAGDRQFLTPHLDDHEMAPGTGRKRSLSVDDRQKGKKKH